MTTPEAKEVALNGLRNAIAAIEAGATVASVEVARDRKGVHFVTVRLDRSPHRFSLDPQPAPAPVGVYAGDGHPAARKYEPEPEGAEDL